MQIPGSSLLSLLSAARPAFMVPQLEAAWLKSEGPSLVSPICSILKAFFPQPVCVQHPSFYCLLIMFSNTHLCAFVKNAPRSWKLVLWIYKDTTLTSLETLLLTHFAPALPDTNSGVPEVHQQLLLCSIALSRSYPNQVFSPSVSCFIFIFAISWGQRLHFSSIQFLLPSTLREQIVINNNNNKVSSFVWIELKPNFPPCPF